MERHHSIDQNVLMRRAFHLASLFVAISVLSMMPDSLSAQQKNSSRQTSANTVRPNTSTVSDSRSAGKGTAGKPAASHGVPDDAMTYERMNKLTGFVPASDDEVRELVDRLQAAAKARDRSAMLECFSTKANVTRITAGARMSPFQQTEFLRGYADSNPFGRLTSESMMLSSDFQLVRWNRRGTELRPLFRLNSKDGGLTYNEFVIQAGGQDGPKVVDMVAHFSGDYLTLSVRPLALGPFLAESSPERIPAEGIDSAIVASAEGLTQISMCLSQGRFSAALAAFDLLQPPLNDQLGTMILKCVVARPIGSNSHREAVQDLRKCYPNTIASDLAFLALKDLYEIQTQPVELMAVAERLLEAIQDPYLNYYRIDGLMSQNRLKEASDAIAAAKAAAPDRSEIYVAEIGLLMRLRNHRNTAHAIEQLELKFGDKDLQLTSFPEFDEFSDSEDGHLLLARRAGFDL